MGKIKVLPPCEVQKIAAGEVVERPASVVKELMENALDAGATTLSLHLEEGGKKLIRLTDNGCGMDADDAHACILNHATSKISSVDELSTLTSFGFRGEALASIATVSHFTLTTKVSTEETAGRMLIVEQGEIVNKKTVAANTGTTIEVRDLFYNVPARQKFLKKKETEWRTIHHLFVAYALANRSKTFSLYHEGQSVLHCPAVATLTERFMQLFDTSWMEQLIPITASMDNYYLEGIVSRPSKTRYDKSHIFSFVNQRWVKNHKLAQALIKGYDNILVPQQYPVGAFFLTMPQELVDINVHPRKEEVQFLKPLIVERFIEDAVRETLTKTVTLALGNTSQKQAFQPAKPWVYREPVRIDPSRTSGRTDLINSPFFLELDEQAKNSSLSLSNPSVSSGEKDHLKACPEPVEWGSARTDAENHSEEPVCCTHKTASPSGAQTIIHKQLNMIAEHEEQSYLLLGQLMSTYLLIENKEGLLLIDQHAAHERVLYQQFEHRFADLEPIALLFPQLIVLTSDELDLLAPYLHFFKEYGIDLEIFGTQQITVRAIPAPLKNINLTDVLKTTASWLTDEPHVHKESFEEPLEKKLRAMMACKAAVKAGDKLTEREMHELIKALATVEHNTTCPHGRPTSWRFTKHDLEKFFQRCGI